MAYSLARFLPVHGRYSENVARSYETLAGMSFDFDRVINILDYILFQIIFPMLPVQMMEHNKSLNHFMQILFKLNYYYCCNWIMHHLGMSRGVNDKSPYYIVVCSNGIK